MATVYNEKCPCCGTRQLRVQVDAINQSRFETCGLCAYFKSDFVDFEVKRGRVRNEVQGAGTLHVIGKDYSDKFWVGITKTDLEQRLKTAYIKGPFAAYITLKVDSQWQAFAVCGDISELQTRFGVVGKATRAIFDRAEDSAVALSNKNAISQAA